MPTLDGKSWPFEIGKSLSKVTDEFLFHGNPVPSPTAAEIQLKQMEAQKHIAVGIRAMQERKFHDLVTIGKSWVDEPPVLPHRNSMETSANRRDMIGMRLHCDPNKFPFPHFNTMYDGETVYISLVVRNQGVMLTDPASEYPSDTLMTQLRLLL